MAEDHHKNSEAESLDAKDATSTASSVDVEQSTTQLEDRVFPDGGLKAWLTVFGATLLLFCCGHLSAFGVFQTYYAEHQLSNFPPSTISWIGALQLWTTCSTGTVWGRIFDAYGPRAVLIPGSILLVLSTMAISVCTQFYQLLLVQGLLTGLATGMLYTPSFACVATHFRKSRTTAAGIAVAGLGVGGVVLPLVFTFLLARIGFGWTIRTWGFLLLVLCAIGNATITNGVRAPAAPKGSVKSRSLLPCKKTLRDVPFISLVAGCFFVDLAQVIPFAYISNYAVSKGIPSSTSFYVVSALNAGCIVGRVGPALIADIVGPFNVASLAAFISGFLVLVFWTFAEALVPIFVFCIMFGVCSGAYLAMQVPCVAQISDTEEVGTRIGIFYSVSSFALLAAGPGAGAMVKADDGKYTGVILLCGGLQIFGSLLILFSRFRVNRNISARI